MLWSVSLALADSPLETEAEQAASAMWRTQVAKPLGKATWVDWEAVALLEDSSVDAINARSWWHPMPAATAAVDATRTQAALQAQLSAALAAKCTTIDASFALMTHATPSEDWVTHWPSRAGTDAVALVKLECPDKQRRTLALTRSSKGVWRAGGVLGAKQEGAWRSIAEAAATDLAELRTQVGAHGRAAATAKATALAAQAFETDQTKLPTTARTPPRLPDALRLGALPVYTCVAQLRVAADGTVASVTFPDCPRVLQGNSREALVEWKFQPPMRDGTPAEAVLPVNVLYRQAWD